MVKTIALILVPLLTGCTLYQSEGREALEKNKGGIINTSGFDIQRNMAYECATSAQVPLEMNGPTVVLETPYETQGFSSYLVQEPNVEKILVYRYSKESSLHSFCRIEPVSALNEKLNYKTSLEAVEFGVTLLMNSTNP